MPRHVHPHSVGTDHCISRYRSLTVSYWPGPVELRYSSREVCTSVARGTLTISLRLSRTQNIVTKINILLQEIRDIKIQNKKNNIFNDCKNHPKDIDGESGPDDTRLIYNTASTCPLLNKQNTLGRHVPTPIYIPNIGDNAFAQQKLNPYKLWSASPPESLSSSSSHEDSMDDNFGHTEYGLIKTGLPWKRVGMGEGESETEGEWETRGRMEEECPGPSSGTVTKPSGPEPDSEAGHR